MSGDTGNIQELISIVHVVVAFGSVLVMYLGYKYLPWHVSRISFIKSIEQQSEELYNSILRLRHEAKNELGRQWFKLMFVLGLVISLVIIGLYSWKYSTELTMEQLFLAWYLILSILWAITLFSAYLCITLRKKCGYQIAGLHGSVSLVFTFSWGAYMAGLWTYFKVANNVFLNFR